MYVDPKLSLDDVASKLTQAVLGLEAAAQTLLTQRYPRLARLLVQYAAEGRAARATDTWTGGQLPPRVQQPRDSTDASQSIA